MPGVVAAGILILRATFGEYVSATAYCGGPSGMMIGHFIATQFGASNNGPLGRPFRCWRWRQPHSIVCLVLAGPQALRLAVRR